MSKYSVLNQYRVYDAKKEHSILIEKNQLVWFLRYARLSDSCFVEMTATGGDISVLDRAEIQELINGQ